MGNVLTPYFGYAAENVMITTTTTTENEFRQVDQPLPALTLIEAARRLLKERTPTPTVGELADMLIDGYPDLCRLKSRDMVRHTAYLAVQDVATAPATTAAPAPEEAPAPPAKPASAPENLIALARELARKLAAASPVKLTTLELTARLKEAYPDVCARRNNGAVYTAAWNALHTPAPGTQKLVYDKLPLTEVARRCLDAMDHQPTTAELIAQMRKRFPDDLRGRRKRTISNAARATIRIRYGGPVDGLTAGTQTNQAPVDIPTAATPRSAAPAPVTEAVSPASANVTVADLLALKGLLVRLGGEAGLRTALDSLRQLGVL